MVLLFFLYDYLVKVIRGVKMLPIFLSAAVATGAEGLILHYLTVSSVLLRVGIGAVSFFGIYFILLLLQKEKFLLENIHLIWNKGKTLLQARSNKNKGV